MKMKKRIQAFVARTQDNPFLGNIYKGSYNFFIKIIVDRISREKSVQAIYLHRGLSGKDMVYGLSDIDLLVFVSNNATEQEIKKIKSTYLELARLIPPLRKSLDEIGIYSTQKFCEMINTIPFYRYRYIIERDHWKLLWGKDIRKEIEVDETTVRLDAWEETRVWWKSLSRHLFGDENLPGIMQGYSWYKALAEYSRIYLLVKESRMISSREKALEEIQSRIRGKGYLIEKVKNFKKDPDFFTSDENKQLMLELILELLIQTGRTIFVPQHTLGPDITIEMDLSPFSLPPIPWEKETGKTHIIPRLEFHPDVLAPRDLYHWDIAVVSPTFDLKKMKGLLHTLSHHPAWTKLNWYPVWTNGEIALSLTPLEPWDAIKTPLSDPVFFGILKSREARARPGKSPENPKISAKVNKDSMESSVTKRINRLKEVLSTEELLKMDPSRFLPFFWSSLRTMALAISIKTGETVRIPLTPRQIAEEVSKVTPEMESVLKHIDSKTKNARGELLYRDMVKAIEAMETLLSRSSQT